MSFDSFRLDFPLPVLADDWYTGGALVGDYAIANGWVVYNRQVTATGFY